jgi:hypothetical protein
MAKQNNDTMIEKAQASCLGASELLLVGGLNVVVATSGDLLLLGSVI